jgi:SAM-dependent methyltransferase
MSELVTAGKQVVKRLLFPGVDVHARSRYRHIPPFLTRGDVATLDAGCGNGMLSYAAYRIGNRVLGVSFDAAEVQRTRRYYHAIGVDDARLRFEQMNLYDLPILGESQFDQVICSEALEHVRDDGAVIRHFAAALRSGGVLHLCCPNAAHPAHALGRVDEPEDGRHVRDGYTLDSYRSLLEPEGFQIEHVAGIGSSAAVRVDNAVRAARERFGHGVAVPLLTLTLPVRFVDRVDAVQPHSIYVKARLHQ